MIFPNLASASFIRRKLYNAVALSIAFTATTAYAAPSGGNVVGGDGGIQQAGTNTTIIQASERLAIDWDSFDIAADERVEFIQPGSESIALNRVIGNDASHILGQLDANGQVILVNPNGVLFGEGASVNVGGLVASGLAIDPADFMNGDLLFQADAERDGFVINQGLITAATGGSVALLGKQVNNEGLIDAKLGSVALAAGREAVLTFDAAGLIGVKVTTEILQNELGLDPAVTNSGQINAAGGRVLLTASASQDVFSQAVNSGDLAGNTDVLVHEDGSFTLGQGASLVNTGSINVSSNTVDPYQSEHDVEDAGKVVLLGEDVQHSGEINALNFSSTGNGGEVVLAASGRTWVHGDGIIRVSATHNSAGDVTLLGRQVGLTETASISATGGGDGGTVTVGGRGSSGESLLADTEITLLGKDASITADGDYEDLTGDGGEISVWSSQATVIDGALSASGFESTGSGGTIDLASEGSLGFNGTADVRGVVSAESGNLILRGQNLQVTENPDAFTIGAAVLDAALDYGNVTLQAVNDLQVGSETENISLNDGFFPDSDHSLTLMAGGNISVANAEILLSNGELTIQSGGDVSLNVFNYLPALLVEGQDVSISASFGFNAEHITAQNLTLATLGEVTAHADVGGTTHLSSTAGGTWQLTGDYNLLTAETGYTTVLTLIDDNDLMLGNMHLADSSSYLTSLGEGATIAQLPDTHIDVLDGGLDLTADNVALGADGTSSIRTATGYVTVMFNDRLSLNGLLDFSSYFDGITILGSDGANQLDIGENAELIPSEYGTSTIDFGAGDDIVNLAADVPVPLSLGSGADVINVLAPDIEFETVDFNEEEDSVNVYSP